MQTQMEAVSERPAPPVLATYTDFRMYLRDYYQYKKQSDGSSVRPYTYSHFSAAADIKSPNYLKLIIEGKRNLSEAMMTKFAKALRLNKEEAEEFRALVRYGQATDPLLRNRYLKDLAELRAKRELAAGNINPETWEKIPNWVGWVLYAMVDQKDVALDSQQLHRLFRSHVTPEQIQQSLQKLLESAQIEKDETAGRWMKRRELIDSAEDVPVELVRKLQSELIYLGLESLFRDSPKEREFGAFTLALTQEEFERVRFELRKVRKKIQTDIMVNREQNPGDRVYQLNIQLFPLTNES